MNAQPMATVGWTLLLLARSMTAAPLDYTVTWVGNSFPGASNRWFQNFLIHTHVQPDGTVNTGSHFQRSTGEHLVLGEENYKAKSLIYRWRP